MNTVQLSLLIYPHLASETQLVAGASFSYKMYDPGLITITGEWLSAGFPVEIFSGSSKRQTIIAEKTARNMGPQITASSCMGESHDVLSGAFNQLIQFCVSANYLLHY